MIDRILTFRGIGEAPSGIGNMLAGVTGRVAGVNATEVDGWPADYGPAGDGGVTGVDYLAALAVGVRAGLADLDAGPAGIIGYSGGAHVAHIIASRGHPNLRYAGFIADPAMPAGAGVPGRFGVTGCVYGPIAVPHRWIYNPADIICQAPADSPIRTISDITDASSAQNFPGWSWEMVERLATARWQVSARRLFAGDPVATWRRFGDAIAGATGYLNGTQHVGAYRGGRQADLAAWVAIAAATAG